MTKKEFEKIAKNLAYSAIENMTDWIIEEVQSAENIDKNKKDELKEKIYENIKKLI